MSMSDRELRALLQDAAPTPRLRDRDALLDSLVARVEAGGVDVADAPAPAATLTAVRPALDETETVEVAAPAQRQRRGRLGVAAASISVAGWIAIGVGSAAAAAAGAWMITHGFDGGGDRGRDSEPTVIEWAEEDSATERDQTVLGTSVLPTTAPKVLWDEADGRSVAALGAEAGAARPTSTAPPDSPSEPQPAVPPASEDDAAPAGGTGAQRSSDGSGQESAPSHVNDDAPDPAEAVGDAPAPAVEAEVSVPVVGGAVEDTTDAVTDIVEGVGDGVTGTVEDVEDTVVDVVPEGPLRDTVRPVIDAVDVSGLVAWLLDSLLCAADSAVAVTASDNVGVEDVSLAVGVAGSTLVDVDLAPAGGDTWTGAVSPLSALDLGILNRVVSVEVTAVDAAGNTATAVTEKTVEILSCLG
ncbi:hypothetical protein [Demequina sp. NBRC 110055]|uniref:hypothetical protein n=1 Tax=Demequina sp. NBRC 110055 TaxID=1570344 RepID=UPI000A020C9B|nr:hypothetical protein [Demequina sp. NBRC 110055]